MHNHLLKSISPEFVSVKTGLGSQHSSLANMICRVQLANYKMGDPFHQNGFFFFLLHEEDQLQDSFKNQDLLKLFTVSYEMQ